MAHDYLPGVLIALQQLADVVQELQAGAGKLAEETNYLQALDRRSGEALALLQPLTDDMQARITRPSARRW